MKKVLVILSFVLLISLLVSCDESSILGSVNKANQTSSTRIIDWIDDDYYLCNSGIYKKGDSTCLLENKGISKVSKVNNTWYVLYAVGGKLYKGVLDNNKIKLDTNPVKEGVTNLTQSGFYTTNSATCSIESNGYILVALNNNIEIYKDFTKLSTYSFSKDVYGFVNVGSKYYIFTANSIYEASENKTVNDDYTPYSNYNIAFAIGSTIIYQTSDGFYYTNDVFNTSTACLSALNEFDDIIEAYKKSDSEYYIVTATNGVYSVKLESGVPTVSGTINL